MKKLLAVGFLFLLALLISPRLNAQETTAAIQGTVTDQTGAVIVGANVVATSDKLVSPATATSDGHGFYRLNALPPGTYAMTVTGEGMTAKITGVKLSAGDLPNLNVNAKARCGDSDRRERVGSDGRRDAKQG